MVRPRRDAKRTHHHVHDPTGILRLRDARSVAVGSGFRRGSLPLADHSQRRLISAGRARVLRDRLHIGNTALVDDSGFVLVRFFRGGGALAQPERDGLVTYFKIPGGFAVQLYEPKYEK
jgi:hypothetical protein